MSFDPTRAWRADLDVRDWGELARTLREDLPNGALRPLVGARRSGKTWALKALAARLDGATFLDLRAEGALDRVSGAGTWLLDEPGQVLRDQPRRLLDLTTRAREAGSSVLIAMTPGEWAALCALDPSGVRVAPRDRWTIPPLEPGQAVRLAARADWAGALLSSLPAPWTRNPFLLELLLSVALRAEGLRADVGQLCQTALLRTRDVQIKYAWYVFRDGLSEAQRERLRDVARGEAAEDDDLALLVDCGLVARQGETLRVADPVLADLLPPPVVIHHVSDVHFGRNAASVLDGGERGPAANAISAALGQGSAAASYAASVADACRGRGAPHLVVVSGDLAEWARPEELSAARAWLDGLSASLSSAAHPDLRPEDPRVLVVGGNHDVDWGAVDPADPQRRHAAFSAAMAPLPCPRLDLPAGRRPAVVARYADLGLEIALLGSAELSGERERDPTVDLLLGLVADLRARAKAAFDAHDEEVYASAQATLDRLDPGLVDQEDLRALDQHPFAEPVRVAVLHHPLSPVPGALELRRYAGLLNAAAVKDTLLRQGFQVALSGHQHIAFLGEESWPELYPDRALTLCSAPSLGSTSVGEKRGFIEIKLRREGSDRHELTLRRHVQRGARWEPEGAPIRLDLRRGAG